MSYRLFLSTPVDESAGRKKGFKENVFFENLPEDYKVYLLYYPGTSLNKDLAKRLKALGKITGKNLLVNICKKLEDPGWGRVVNIFGIKKIPAIIITAHNSLASPPTDYSTAFVRIDDNDLLSSTDNSYDLMQKIFNLFSGGKVSEAMRENTRDKRMFKLKRYLTSALKGLENWLQDKEINFHTALGRLEIKPSNR